MTAAVCPVCFAEQAESLLCHNCTTAVERELGDVAAIVGELDTALSKQARIGNAGGSGGNKPKGWDREKLPIGVGAIDPRWVIDNVLTTWARDIMGYADAEWNTAFVPNRSPSITAAYVLLSNVPLIRRHPAVVELVDEITDAIRQARRVVDRPADRQFVGPCLAESPDDEGRQVTCLEDLYARHGASEVRCKVCSTEHPVAERRAWLLEKAKDRLFTVQETAQMMGDVGGIKVTEASIRGYIHRGRIAYHTARLIRLGDLLTVVLDEGERRSA